MLVANGHSWLSIKQYTLSEIGSFFKTIVIMERERKVESLSQLWMGSNMDFETLQKVLSSLDPNYKQNRGEATVSDKEVKSEWNRLKAFMGGKK